MNKQNFTSNERFPLSTQSLSFMQEMIDAAAGLARIGGDNYILSGCVTTGNNVSPGLIVINGEIMPFEGGGTNSTITIIETPESISANGLTFENVRVKRYARFATGTGENYINWNLFKPLQTNVQLEKVKATVKYVDDQITQIQAKCVPTGMVAMWSGSTTALPAGWALCNGNVVNGVRTPDLRGRFIVGHNPTLGSSYINIGEGNKGTEQYKITLTKDEMPKHNHSQSGTSGAVERGGWGLIRRSNSNEKLTAGSLDTTDAGTQPDVNTTPNRIPMEGGSKPFDIRPPYYVLAYIIKL